MNSKTNKRNIGIGIMIFAIFIIGVGIGLKAGNSEINTTLFTIPGLFLNVIGLSILVTSQRKTDK